MIFPLSLHSSQYLTICSHPFCQPNKYKISHFEKGILSFSDNNWFEYLFTWLLYFLFSKVPIYRYIFCPVFGMWLLFFLVIVLCIWNNLLVISLNEEKLAVIKLIKFFTLQLFFYWRSFALTSFFHLSHLGLEDICVSSKWRISFSNTVYQSFSQDDFL